MQFKELATVYGFISLRSLESIQTINMTLQDEGYFLEDLYGSLIAIREAFCSLKISQLYLTFNYNN